MPAGDIIVQQGQGLRREQHGLEEEAQAGQIPLPDTTGWEDNYDTLNPDEDDDVYPWVISHRLFPIALLTQDEAWYDRIAKELRVSVDVVRKIVSDEGGRV